MSQAEPSVAVQPSATSAAPVPPTRATVLAVALAATTIVFAPAPAAWTAGVARVTHAETLPAASIART